MASTDAIVFTRLILTRKPYNHKQGGKRYGCKSKEKH